MENLQVGSGILQDGLGILQDGLGILQGGLGILQGVPGILHSGLGILQGVLGILQGGLGILQGVLGILHSRSWIQPGHVPSAALDKLGFEPVDMVCTIVVPSISSLFSSTSHAGDAEHSIYQHKPGSSFWYSDHSQLYQH